MTKFKLPVSRLGLRILTIGLPGVLMVLSYQNCSRFDAGSGTLTTNSASSTSPGTTPNATPDPSPAPNPSPSPMPSPTPAPSAPLAGLLWGDDFDTFSLYDRQTKTGNWEGTSVNATDGGNGWGAEYDISPLNTTLGVMPYQVANGQLTIRTDRAPAALQAKINNYKYTSGALRTVNPSFGYAYYEMRAQLPKGNGLWPAFWLLPADGGWPPEIDIVEGLGNNPMVPYATVHSTKKFANAVTYSSGHWQSGADPNVGVDTTAGFHRYGCDFRADFITFYFDGKQIFKSPTPPDLVNRKMYIVLDTAIGGWNDNDVDATTKFPADFMIDYVRVFSAIP